MLWISTCLKLYHSRASTHLFLIVFSYATQIKGINVVNYIVAVFLMQNRDLLYISSYLNINTKRKIVFFWMSFASWCSMCLCVVLCVCLCTGHFVLIPLKLTCLHCLQHSFFSILSRNVTFTYYHVTGRQVD